jgi:hypothetical protein
MPVVMTALYWAAVALLLRLPCAGAVISHLSKRESAAETIRSCSLFVGTIADSPVAIPATQYSSYNQRGQHAQQGQEQASPMTAGVGSKVEHFLEKSCNFKKHTNPYCTSLPAVSLSSECNLVNLTDPVLYSGHPREVVLYGDSVTLQVESALRCLLSRNSPVRVADNSYGEKGGPEIKNAAKGVGGARRRLHSAQKEPGAVKYSIGLKGAACRKQCRSWGSLTVCVMRTNEHVLQRDTAACLLNSRPSMDVHVFNIGMWHNSRSAMSRAVGQFAKFIKAARAAGERFPHLVWRESTPQHFAARGGNYVGKRTGSCMKSARTKEMEAGEFRNAATWDALAGLDIDVMAAWELLDTPNYTCRNSKAPRQIARTGARQPRVQ